MADDQPIWGNNQAVAPTAIVSVELRDNFTEKGHHLSMIKDRQFDGRTLADPHKHIAEFVKICGMFRYGTTNVDSIKLKLFPSSLSKDAEVWYKRLSLGVITTWEEMKHAFVSRFFTPAMFDRLMGENLRKTIAFLKVSKNSKLMKKMEALTTKIDSQSKDIKGEMKEIRDGCNNYGAYGTLSRYKARVVAKDSTQIIMENVPPPNNNLNVLEEEPIPNQAPAALIGFAPQWIGGKIPNNNNGWLEEYQEEDDEDDLEEYDEEDLEEEDDEMNEDDDEEQEGGNGEEEKMEIDEKVDTPKVIDPDEPPPPKFQEDDLHMNRNEFKASVDYSKMTRLVEGLSKQVNELKLQCSRAKRLSQWEVVRPCIPERLRFQEESPIPSAFGQREDDPYDMARDAAMATQEDDDDDAVAAAKDPQPSKSCGSSRDTQ
nr:reverse transcriptase domain-containing protein [Tanacetum cinerariifolium]